MTFVTVGKAYVQWNRQQWLLTGNNSHRRILKLYWCLNIRLSNQSQHFVEGKLSRHRKSKYRVSTESKQLKRNVLNKELQYKTVWS